MKTQKPSFNVLMGLASLVLVGVSAQAQSFLTDGLVAYYPFNGNGNDASGNGHDGTLSNVAPGSNRFGESGQALQFTPGLYSKFETPGTFIPSGHNPMSVSLWMRIENPTLPPVGFSKYPVMSGTLDVSTTWNLNFVFQGNGVDFTPNVERFDSTGYLGEYSKWSLFPSYQAALDWHQITLSFRSDTETALFLDGQKVEWEKPQSPILTDRNDGTFAIGWAPGNSSFSGSLDDVRIYNRALSDQEAGQLYQATAVPEPRAYAVVVAVGLLGYLALRRRTSHPSSP